MSEYQQLRSDEAIEFFDRKEWLIVDYHLLASDLILRDFVGIVANCRQQCNVASNLEPYLLVWMQKERQELFEDFEALLLGDQSNLHELVQHLDILDHHQILWIVKDGFC